MLHTLRRHDFDTHDRVSPYDRQMGDRLRVEDEAELARLARLTARLASTARLDEIVDTVLDEGAPSVTRGSSMPPAGPTRP